MTDADRLWTYREIQCRLYEIDLSDEHRWLGYAKFGDEWVEACDRDFGDEDDAVEAVESFVDTKLLLIKVGEAGKEIDVPDVPDIPDPLPDPQRPSPINPKPWKPDPQPNPWGPLWEVEHDDQTDLPSFTDDSGCRACRRLRRGLTWVGDTPPKCPKHRDIGSTDVYQSNITAGRDLYRSIRSN